MKKLILLCTALFIIFSCEKESLIEGSHNPVEGKISFFPREYYNDYNSIDTPNLKLCFSAKAYIDGGILHCTSIVESNELIVRFDSVQNHISIGFQPPVAYVDLPENINRITLINGNFIDKYDVIISKEKVEIDSLLVNNTILMHNKIFRYPENTFNFTCWTDNTDASLCDDFLIILNNELTLQEYEFVGEGKIPFSYYTSNELYHCTAVFKYEKESDYDRAGELLKQFTLEHIPQNEGKSISMFGWNNKYFQSHTFYE